MGFFESFSNAYNGEPEGSQYEVCDKLVTCSHCGGTRFEQGSAQLNTAGLSFLDLDWLNKSATIFKCADCGHIEWFV